MEMGNHIDGLAATILENALAQIEYWFRRVPIKGQQVQTSICLLQPFKFRERVSDEFFCKIVS